MLVSSVCRLLRAALLACLIVGAAPESALARHIVGGEVTYECLGDGAAGTRRYEIKVTMYRDCYSGGALFDGAPGASSRFELTIFSAQSIFQRVEVSGRDLEIERIPVDLANPCIVLPPNVCVERGVYTLQIDLPISSETYTVSYQRCCRNETISNIVAPGDAGATYFIEIGPESQQACNSSPVFDNFPPLVICAGQLLEFDGAATDAEGDVLEYSLCRPVYGGGNITQGAGVNSFDGVTPNPESPPPYAPIVFSNQYNFQRPVDGTIDLNTQTGLLTVLPATVGQFVVCMSVREYRRGVLLSEVRRDFQFNIVNCDPRIVAGVTAIVGADSVSPDLILVCGDKTANLVDISTDRNFIDEIEWVIPGTIDGVVRSNARRVDVTFPEYGTYPAQLVANPGLVCDDTVNFKIIVAPPISVALDFAYDTCVVGPVSFTSDPSLPPDSVSQYSWEFGDGQTSTLRDPMHDYAFGGRRTIVHRIRDLVGCRAEATKVLEYFPVPPSLDVDVASESSCAPASFAFRQTSGVLTDDYDILWDFGNGDTSTELEPDYVYREAGTYAVYIRVISPAGCFIDTQLTTDFTILESPTAGFTYAPSEIDIRDPAVQFLDASRRAASWEWAFDTLGSSRELNPAFTFPDSGFYDIRLAVSHLNGCLDTARARLRVEPFQTLFLPNAFTPQDDGLNERFRPAGFMRYVTDFEMKIFNRWGEEIYVTDDRDRGWDGTNQRNGQRASAGVYLFLVTYGGLNGRERAHGYVTLVE